MRRRRYTTYIALALAAVCLIGGVLGAYAGAAIDDGSRSGQFTR